MADLFDPDDSPDLFEHLFRWLNRYAPQYLDDLRRSSDAPTAKEVLSYYCRTRDEGAWLSLAYRETTGRYLPTDTLAVLRQWFTQLRLSWLGRDPVTGWQPVHSAQLMRLLPEDHIEGIELMHALRPVLGGIYSGIFDFGGERHRVRAEPQHRSLTADRIEQAMRTDIANGKLSLVDLARKAPDPRRYTEAYLASQYRASRKICRTARDRILQKPADPSKS